MPTLRRLYLYPVALVSLMALLAGLVGLSVGLIRLAFNIPPLALGGIALAGGNLGSLGLVVLISGPVWALHWWLANRRAAALTMAGAPSASLRGRSPSASLRGRSAERSAAERKMYFYAGRFGALVAFAGLAGWLIYELLAHQLHAAALSGAWPAGPLSLAAGLLVAFLFWLYLDRTARSDGDAGHEQGAGAGWRRAYDYLGLWLATVAAAAGAVGLLQAGLTLLGRLLGDPAGLAAAGAWRTELAASVAALIVAGPIARWHWRRADWVVADDPTGSEINSPGRKLALYTLLLGGAGVTVLSSAYLVMVTTLLLLGQPVDDLAAVWERTIAPLLGYLPVGPFLWAVFGRALWNDVAWAPEARGAAALRHLYFYFMAGILLAGFWWGLQQVLAVALFLALGLEQWAGLADPTVRSTTAVAMALCVVAGPAWWWHWSRVQSWVEELALDGRDDRASLLRRIYLYGVIVAAAGVVIVTLGIVVTRAPALLLGPHTQADFGASLVQFGVAVSLGLLWWLGHGLVLRDDARAQAQGQGEETPSPEAGEGNEGSGGSSGPWRETSPDGAPAAVEAQEGADQAAAPAAGAGAGFDAAGPEMGAAAPETTAGGQPAALAAAPHADAADAGPTGGAAAGPAALPGPPLPLAAPPPAARLPGRPLRRGQFSREELAAVRAAFEARQAAAARPAPGAAGPASAGEKPSADASAAAEAGEQAVMAASTPSTSSTPSTPAAGSAVVVVDGGSGAAGAAVLQALRRALPEVTLWPIGLNDAAQEAMYLAADGGRSGVDGVPVDALERALVIVGPRGMATAGGLAGEVPPELAAAIVDSPARKVVLQPFGPAGRGGNPPAWALDRWAAQAVAEVSAALAGG